LPSRAFLIAFVSMSLIPSGELKVSFPPDFILASAGINESNSLRGVESDYSRTVTKGNKPSINESNSLRGVESASIVLGFLFVIGVSMSLIPSGELKVEMSTPSSRKGRMYQ